MAKRKARTTRTARSGRAGGQKKAGRKGAAAPARERRRREKETLRLRAFEPTFTVNDIERSMHFYTDILGFVVKELMTDGGVLQGVLLRAGVCQLGLSQDDWAKGRDRKKGEGMRIWCNTVQDIDALAQRITASGGRLAEEPKNLPDGIRSLSVEDPDGFRLTIFSKP